MTIIEAIKSGKPFRRKGEKNWYGNSPGAAKMFHIESMGVVCHYASIIADDWEVEEKKVEITGPQLKKAIESAVYEEFIDVYKLFSHVAKELGL